MPDERRRKSSCRVPSTAWRSMAVIALTFAFASGCALLERGSRHETERPEQPDASTTGVDMPPAVHDEEIVGPPELEGPPRPAADEEVVGPPHPVETAPQTASSEDAGQPSATTRALLQALAQRDVAAQVSLRGVTVTLPDTVFKYGTAELLKPSKTKLREIAAAAREQAPAVTVSVDGYTDSIGAELFNQGLSERRAKAVAAELIAAGIARETVSWTGFGSRFPIAANTREDGGDDPEGRARNRRVEIVFLTQNVPGR